MMNMGDSYAFEKDRLIEEINSELEETHELTGIAKLSSPVEKALRKVPRHEFVPPHLRAYAYNSLPLPIDFNQTISSPFIVAFMTEVLAVQPEDRILEVGTGSGYQAAILAHLASQVFTIEVLPALAQKAQNTLNRLGYTSIQCRVGDGSKGWVEEAPFDKIIVTAAAQEVPPDLISQLKPLGRLILPLEDVFGEQTLVLIEKDSEGNPHMRFLLPVAFVPLR